MGSGQSLSSGIDDRAVMGPAAGTIPFGNIFVRPLIGLINVAAIAGIGRTQFDAEIRPRYPKTVVCTQIDPHIEAFRHMAPDTLGPGTHIEQNPTIR